MCRHLVLDDRALQFFAPVLFEHIVVLRRVWFRRRELVGLSEVPLLGGVVSDLGYPRRLHHREGLVIRRVGGHPPHMCGFHPHLCTRPMCGGAACAKGGVVLRQAHPHGAADTGPRPQSVASHRPSQRVHFLRLRADFGRADPRHDPGREGKRRAPLPALALRALRLQRDGWHGCVHCEDLEETQERGRCVEGGLVVDTCRRGFGGQVADARARERRPTDLRGHRRGPAQHRGVPPLLPKGHQRSMDQAEPDIRVAAALHRCACGLRTIRGGLRRHLPARLPLALLQRRHNEEILNVALDARSDGRRPLLGTHRVGGLVPGVAGLGPRGTEDVAQPHCGVHPRLVFEPREFALPADEALRGRVGGWGVGDVEPPPVAGHGPRDAPHGLDDRPCRDEAAGGRRGAREQVEEGGLPSGGDAQQDPRHPRVSGAGGLQDVRHLQQGGGDAPAADAHDLAARCQDGVRDLLRGSVHDCGSCPQFGGGRRKARAPDRLHTAGEEQRHAMRRRLAHCAGERQVASESCRQRAHVRGHLQHAIVALVRVGGADIGGVQPDRP
mmetsp:Transcript_103888/g.300474  ORF Transcript_103888/g.300474 Transcript_103888/m.300474 type:complete len:555 (-) Transcript_103888:1252-2916(-)